MIINIIISLFPFFFNTWNHGRDSRVKKKDLKSVEEKVVLLLCCCVVVLLCCGRCRFWPDVGSVLLYRDVSDPLLLQENESSSSGSMSILIWGTGFSGLISGLKHTQQNTPTVRMGWGIQEQLWHRKHDDYIKICWLKLEFIHQ